MPETKEEERPNWQRGRVISKISEEEDFIGEELWVVCQEPEQIVGKPIEVDEDGRHARTMHGTDKTPRMYETHLHMDGGAPAFVPAESIELLATFAVSVRRIHIGQWVLEARKRRAQISRI